MVDPDHLLERGEPLLRTRGMIVSRTSHPAVGVHQTLLSPPHWELNISPDTVLERNLFAPPDQNLCELVLKLIYEYMFHPNCWFLTRELNWSETLRPKKGNPYRGVTSYVVFMMRHPRGNCIVLPLLSLEADTT